MPSRRRRSKGTSPTKTSAEGEEKGSEFAIADSQSNLIPLFFNQEKQFVRAAPEFDEDKYVAIYEENL
jgi:hypothetical protein